MLDSIMIAVGSMALLSLMGRWIYMGGVRNGESRAVERIDRKLDEHIEGFLDWWMEAPDLERMKWRQTEVNAYCRGFSNARRLVNERRID